MSGQSPSGAKRVGSLRLRLLIGTLTWIIASIVIAGWGLHRLFAQHVTEQFDADLIHHLDQLIAGLVVDENGVVSISALSDPRFLRPYSGLYWQVDGARQPGLPVEVGLFRSRSLWDAVLQVPTDLPADGEVHRHGIAGPTASGLRMTERLVKLDERQDAPLRLIVAADESLLSEPIDRFNRMLLLSLGVLALGLAFAAIVQVRVGLAPFRVLRQKLASVHDGRSKAIEGRFPSEVQPLVDDFNSVLSLNAEVVDRARTQAGNLAHAVKTPLSVIANAAELEQTPLARLVIDQVGLARRQVDYHLARARAAAALSASGLRCEVRPALEGLIRVMDRLHQPRDLQIELEAPEAAVWFRGEAQDLQEMAGNLLDNACKWAKRRVIVRVEQGVDLLRIVMDDDGDGLPEDAREAVFSRGVRADEQVPGSGLGLAIVRDLALLYRGDVKLETSPMGGLRVTLLLPSLS